MLSKHQISWFIQFIQLIRFPVDPNLTRNGLYDLFRLEGEAKYEENHPNPRVHMHSKMVTIITKRQNDDLRDQLCQPRSPQKRPKNLAPASRNSRKPRGLGLYFRAFCRIWTPNFMAWPFSTAVLATSASVHQKHRSCLLEKNAINLKENFQLWSSTAPLAPFRACRPAPGIKSGVASNFSRASLPFDPPSTRRLWCRKCSGCQQEPATFFSGSSMVSRQHQGGGISVLDASKVFHQIHVLFILAKLAWSYAITTPQRMPPPSLSSCLDLRPQQPGDKFFWCNITIRKFHRKPCELWIWSVKMVSVTEKWQEIMKNHVLKL